MSTTKSDQGSGAGAPDPGINGASEGRSQLGIALSGGGIRSAAFSLGVCQRLIEAGIFRRASHLSAVSGGSYLAAGLAISNAECPPELRDAEPPPWGRLSPEERELRQNLSYLAPGSTGRLWLFANLLYGLLLNLIPLVLGAYLCGRVAGLLLRFLYPGLAEAGEADFSALPIVLAVAAGFALLAVAVVGRRRFLDRDDSRKRLNESSSERVVMILLGLVAVVVALGVLLPAIVAALAQVSNGRPTDFGLGGATFSIRRLVICLIVLVLSIGMGGIAVWLLRRRRMATLRSVLAYLSGIGILFAPFLLATQTATARGFALVDYAPVFLCSLAIIVAFGVFVHNRRYSMHLFYRERLQDAFAFRRVPSNNKRGFDVEKIPYDESIFLSRIARENAEQSKQGQPFPQLVMCAAVAARGTEVPNKTWAANFTFAGRQSGNASLGLKAPTGWFEAGSSWGGGHVTLPGMMAISGAAVSPLMGRFTLPGFRFLMAMLDIRLGVWLRNPTYRPLEPAPSSASWWRRATNYVVRGWQEPGAWYVLKEALGLADAKGPFIYVSDGGHWENLGLIELLRHDCTEVIVVDASADPGLGDIARAMAVARAELGIEFDFDPRVTAGGEGALASTPVQKGSFEYPDGRTGTIYYARAVLWGEAPSDLHLFARRERRFPNHPTSNQFLSGELFDAYRALGSAVGVQLLEHLAGLPPEDWDAEQIDFASASSDFH